MSLRSVWGNVNEWTREAARQLNPLIARLSGISTASMASKAGYAIVVNGTEDGLEFTAGGGGSGTVTSVSVTTANGVSGSVATATTTPAISLALGAITPSSVAASGTVTGSNLSGTNTGDQTAASLGLVIGTDVQAYDADLAAIAALADPNADRILFWDDSAGQFTHLSLGAGISIAGTTLTATGAATWTEVKWWDQAVDGSASTIEADVTGATEILIVGSLLTNTNAVQRIVQVSTDGGSSWYTTSGNYNEISTAGVSANNIAFFPHVTTSTAARSFTVQIVNNGTSRKPVVANMPTRSVTGQFIASTTAINRIRVAGTTDAVNLVGSFTGGTIQVLIR